jgi:4-hydroxy-tetrahydrodipicolinate reductase
MTSALGSAMAGSDKMFNTAALGQMALPDGSGVLPLGKDVAALMAFTRPDVIVDFTNADWTPKLAREALDAGVRLVIGTTGLPDAFVSELGAECSQRGIGAVLAANFALGAVLMQHMARIASPYYSHAEIIEMHHEEGRRSSPAPPGHRPHG